jgi:hypothetical protein
VLHVYRADNVPVIKQLGVLVEQAAGVGEDVEVVGPTPHVQAQVEEGPGETEVSRDTLLEVFVYAIQDGACLPL